MGNKLKNIIKRFWPYFVLVIVVTYIFRHFFFEKGLVTYVDTAPFNLNMGSLKEFANSLWISRYTGTGLYTNLPAFVQNFFAMNIIYSVLNFFIKNVYINNTLWVFLPYPIFALSVYLFVSLFVKNKYISTLCTLIYIFSYIFFMWFISSGSNILVWAVSGSILFCYSFIKMLQATNLEKKLSFTLMGVLSSLLGLANIAYFFVFVLFLGLFYILSALYKTMEVNLKELKKAFLWGTAVVAANLFWIVPIIFMGGGDKAAFGGNDDALLSYHSMCATPTRNIMYMFCGAEPSNRTLYALLYISIFSLIALFALKSKDYLKKVFLLLFMIFYTLSLGLNTPFWKFASKVPGSFLFRTPQRMFEVMMLIFVTLLGMVITEYKSKILLALTLVLLTVCLVPYSYMNENGKNMRDEVPQSYFQAANYLETNNHQSTRVLVYPSMPNFMARTWQKTNRISPPIIDFFLNERLVMSWLKGDSVPTVLRPLFNMNQVSNNVSQYQKILGFYNIGYILTQRDIKEIYTTPYNTQLNELAKTITGNRNIFDSKEINIYKVEENEVLPVIYGSQTLKEVDKEEEIFEKINVAKAPEAYVVNANETNTEFDAFSIKFNKTNSTKYTVNARGKGENLLLVFQEYYHPGWTLKTGNKNITAKHIRVNGFENAWVVNLKAVKNTGDNYDFEINYKPQLYYDLFVKITYLLISGLSVALILLFIKRGKND